MDVIFYICAYPLLGVIHTHRGAFCEHNSAMYIIALSVFVVVL